jgi:cephalosporin hydroxylase
VGLDKMKWNQDLTTDIRTHSEFDDTDNNDGRISVPGWTHPSNSPHIEVTDANILALQERFLRVRDNCKAILEIGVSREGNAKTTTSIFLNNKHPDTIYIGIDMDDKSHLNDPAKNIHTIQASSFDVESNLEKIRALGVTEFGFIFIDGWHSINAVLTEWEYTNLLSANGIVGFHDTTQHPGPHYFIKALNKSIWEVEENLCPDDYGIGFTWKK